MRTGTLSRGGFTLVELIVAVVVLAVGILGTLGTLTILNRQATLADLRAERSRATGQVLERLRALPWDSVDSGSDSVGRFFLEWGVVPEGQAKRVTLTVRGPGPGAIPGGPAVSLVPDLVDTVTYRIARP